MGNTFMNLEDKKISDTHWLRLNFTDKMDLQQVDTQVALSDLSI